jgi:catechol 2,3-dioxygenase-like lactoylglutathione lyase family enzyme
MLGAHKLIAFVTTADPARSKAFYEETLGLRLVADDPYALVYDANGIALRIQKVPEVAPRAHTVLGWQVDDIASVIRGLVARGVTFERYSFMDQDDLGVWHTPDGGKVAWFKDPDGNVLSLTEL